ncbi:Guanylate cyclase domain-containing protein, variant 3 [Balamuthia mandrillaris]
MAASKFEWKMNLEAEEEEDILIKDFVTDTTVLSILENITLRVKVSVSAGDVVAMQLGGVNGRWEYLLAGKPLEEIAATEQDAAVSTVVVTSYVWSMLKPNNNQKPQEAKEVSQELEAPTAEGNEEQDERGEYYAKQIPSGNFIIRKKYQPNEDVFSSTQTTMQDSEDYEQDEDQQLLPTRKFRSNAIVGSALSPSFSLMRIRKERALIKLSISSEQQGRFNWMQGYVPEPLRKWLEEGYSLHHLADIRQTTVLFIGLCGLDTTTMNCFEPLQKALTSAEEVLLHYKGALRQFIIDDKGAVLIAVFGLPHMTLEDDAVRAVNAALVINARLHALNLFNSIGIATGKTFCGNVGSSKRCEYCVVGDSVNLSARLMVASAKASNGGKASGAIYVDEQTYRVVTESESRFLLQPLEPILVKGKKNPIPIYTPIEGRRKSLREAIISPRQLIGRTHEMNLFRNAFDTFMHQEHHPFKVVFIKGQAGMGKTAMVRELLNWTTFQENGKEEVLIIDGQAPEVEKNTPYFIWQEILSTAFDFPVIMQDESVCRSSDESYLKGFLSKMDPALAKYVAVLNPLLVTQFPETDESNQLKAKERRDILHAFLSFMFHEFRCANGNRPIVLVMENCHWLDSASWGVVAHMLNAADAHHGLFLVLTSRPPQERTFSTSMHEEVDVVIEEEVRQEATALAANIKYLEEAHAEVVLTIELNRMSNEQIAELAKAVMQTSELNEAEEGILFSKSQGNPMIAISLASTLPKLKLVCSEDVCFMDPSTIRQLPSSVESAITSTVDKLSVNQQIILKVASVIGSRFSAAQLQTVLTKAGKDELGQEQFLKELDALRQMAILSVSLDREDLLYFFDNAFAQKTIYDMMPFSERYKYHAIIADWYEQRFSTNSAPHYPVLAYHWRRAQDFLKAIRYYDLAGEFAYTNYAGKEASSSWLQAIKLHERILNMCTSASASTKSEKQEKEEKRHRYEKYLMEQDSGLRVGRWYRMVGLAKGQVGNLLDSVSFTKKALQILGMPVPETDETTVEAIHRLLKQVLVHHMYSSRLIGRLKDDPKNKELLYAYKRLMVSGILLSWDNKIFTVLTLQLAVLAEQCDILLERAFAYSFVLINVNRFYHNWNKFAGYHWGWLHNLFQRKCNALIQRIDQELQQHSAETKEEKESRKLKLMTRAMLELRTQFLLMGEPGCSLTYTIQRLEALNTALTEVGEHSESDSMKTLLLVILYLQGELERGIRLADELLENVKKRKYPTHEEATIRMKSMILIRKGNWEAVKHYNEEMVEKKLHKISPSVHFAFLLRVAYCHLANGQMDALRENLTQALSLWEDAFLQQMRILAPLQLAFEESIALWEYEIAVREKQKENNDNAELEECERRCEFVLGIFWKMSAIFTLGRCGAWYSQGMFFALSGMIDKAHICWDHTKQLYNSAPDFFPVERALVLLAKARFPRPSSQETAERTNAKRVRRATAAMKAFQRMDYQPFAQQCKQLLHSLSSSSFSSSC